MRFVVCDDEKVFINQFESVVSERYSRLDVTVESFCSSIDLLKSIDEGQSYDAYFLDIEMDEIDGMSLAREIRKRLHEIPIVFLTSHIEMAIDGYEVAAFRFLKKPVEKDKLYQTIEDLKQLSRGRKGVVLKIEGEDTVIVPSDVLFIESENNDIRVITKNKTYTTRMKLADAMELFNSVADTFTRIHRCTIVNMAHVSRIREKEVVLDNAAVLAISRGCFKEFKAAFYDYVKSSVR
ncbi:MAG: LytTR family DNA-binding domain-containing protein [Saccharofermentans sp.]|nr:LytTR family DNA-binding domain-containing protein [Saccharofermentans sp.]